MTAAALRPSPCRLRRRFLPAWKGQRFYAVAQDGGVHDITLRLAAAVKLDWFSLKEKQ